MWNPFLIFMKSNDSEAVGIDIGASSIKAVQLRKKHGKVLLATYGEIALGPYANTEVGRATKLSPDQIAAAVKDLFREANITTVRAGVAIPSSGSLLALIEVPPVSDKDLAQMIPLEARKYIPVPIAEVSLDWSIVPEDFSGIEESETGPKKKEVMVVAIHKEVIARYQDIITKAGLDVSFLEVEVFSTIRSVLGETRSAALIFDMGASTTKLYLVHRGVVKNSHTINRGSQDITLAIATALQVTVAQAENLKRGIGVATPEQKAQVADVVSLTMETIFAETNQVVLGFERHYNTSISKVILTGGGAAYPGLAELAKKKIETEVVLGNPFAKAAFPAFLEQALAKSGPEFSVAMGAALRRLEE